MSTGTSVRIQDALSNCCHSTKEIMVSAAKVSANTCQKGFHYALDLTGKGAELARSAATQVATWAQAFFTNVASVAQPAFERGRTFAQENPGTIMLAVGSAAVGAIVSRLLFANKSN